MKNKKQIHLKTVIATTWVEPKTLSSFAIIKPCKFKHSPTRYSPRPSSSSRKSKCPTELRQGRREGDIKQLLIHNILNQKTTLKMFPKRESMIKNTNPYRYFLGSTKKILTQQPEEKRFHDQLHGIIQKNSIQLKRSSFTVRSRTETASGKIRLKPSLPINVSKTFRVKDSNNPEPWFNREQQMFDMHFDV